MTIKGNVENLEKFFSRIPTMFARQGDGSAVFICKRG